MNPKRRRKAKRTRSTRKSTKGRKRARRASMKRNAKGRFVKGAARISNPRRRKHRKHRAKARRSNNPRHRRYSRRRHRNPSFRLPSMGGIGQQLTSAGVGGAGAILNSVVLGYLA